MAIEALVMPAIMAFALVVLVWGVRSRGWRDYDIGGSSGSSLGRFLNWLWSSPVAWLILFVLVTVGLGVAAVLAVSRDRLVAVGEGTLLTVSLGAILALLAGFLFFGSYFSMKSRGTQNSLAAVLSALLMGFVVLGVVTLRLAGLL